MFKVINYKKIITPIFALSILIVLSSCKPKVDNNPINFLEDPRAKLKLDYNNHTFLKDGVGQVTLKTTIDGDTAHFYSTGDANSVVKSRFYGIDTPESTGKVEPYGKTASLFTEEKLNNASKNGTIVLTSTAFVYQKPETDSTGTRYLSFIWINETEKNAPIEKLYLLNLAIVQEGLSTVKGVDKVPQYSSIFYEAEEQAKKLKLNMHSGENDPLFNYGDYKDTSLLEIKKEIEKSIEDSNHKNKFHGQKVRVQGTVAGYVNRVLYLTQYFPNEDEYAGLNVFTGMGAIPSKYTTQGNVVELAGILQDGQFGFQLTGVTTQQTKPKKKNDGKVLYKVNDENIPEHFKLKIHDISLKNNNIVLSKLLYNYLNIEEEVLVTGGKKNENGDILTLYLKKIKGQKNINISVKMTFTYKPFKDKPNLVWSDVNDFVNKKFKLKGILTYGISAQNKVFYSINPINANDFELIE